MKKFKKQAEDEVKALDALKKYIFNVPDVGPLMKSLLRESIISFQETLRDAWDISGTRNLDSFNISNENLCLHKIQMQNERGEWMRVGHGGFRELPVGVTIRLEVEGQFFEANGQTEFFLTTSPILTQKGEHAIWIIQYQV